MSPAVSAEVGVLETNGQETTARNAKCPDGVRRTVRLNAGTDTARTWPGRCSYGGKTVRGYVIGANGTVQLKDAKDLLFMTLPATTVPGPGPTPAGAKASPVETPPAPAGTPAGTGTAKQVPAPSPKAKKAGKAPAKGKPTVVVVSKGSGKEKHPKVIVNVKAEDAARNAYLLLGKVSKAMRVADIPVETVAQFQRDATAKFYDEVLAVCAKWVNVQMTKTGEAS